MDYSVSCCVQWRRLGGGPPGYFGFFYALNSLYNENESTFIEAIFAQWCIIIVFNIPKTKIYAVSSGVAGVGGFEGYLFRDPG